MSTEDLGLYADACVKIDQENLSREFSRVSSDFAFWAQKYSDALKNYLVLKVEKKNLYSRHYIMARESLQASGTKPTEALIDATVDSQEEVQEINMLFIDAEVEKERLGNLLDSIRIKKDLLQQLGAQHREEMRGDLSMRDSNYSWSKR